jgi:ribosomal protein S18 acetylase RimI-like enzyme
MQHFKTWLENQELIGRKLPTNQPLQITGINQEDDWEIADQVDQIAKKTQIRPNSNKEVTLVAQVGEEIIGGVYSATYEEEYGRVYDFDVVVDPQWQGYQNVGFKLIDAAIQDAKSNECHTIQAHVVNPRLAVILANKYGFDGMPQHWDGKTPMHGYSTILTRQI